MFAMARYAGLRIPSETRSMKWGDINWEKHRMLIRSPKTEHHKGKATRIVPIFPELLPFLLESHQKAEEGQEKVFAHRPSHNLRTMGRKIIERAGLTVWPKMYQNLRASCETDLTAKFPLHVACMWIGNSTGVAMRHYLQVTEQHFLNAVKPPPELRLNGMDSCDYQC